MTGHPDEPGRQHPAREEQPGLPSRPSRHAAVPAPRSRPGATRPPGATATPGVTGTPGSTGSAGPTAPPGAGGEPAASRPAGTAAELEEAAYVRPYLVTGGRTRTRGRVLPIEALVEGLAPPVPGLPPECSRILQLTAGRYLSVAELSAHIRLPIGVVRVLVDDLSDEGSVRVHGLTSAGVTVAPATTLSVLESVLNGISAL